METSSRAAPAARIFVGIDVSKAMLDVALRPGDGAWRSANDEPGIAEVVKRLQPLGPDLIVLEATGGLERLVVAALALADLPVAVVNPRQVRDFAKATGRLAKTDALDAAALAHFAEALRPEPRPLPDAQSQALAALVERRRQLVAMLTAEKNRFQQALARVRPKVGAPIAWLEQALAEWDEELDQLLHASPLWRERDQLLRSVPGVGPIVSLTLLAHLPELGQGSDEDEIARAQARVRQLVEEEQRKPRSRSPRQEVEALRVETAAFVAATLPGWRVEDKVQQNVATDPRAEPFATFCFHVYNPHGFSRPISSREDLERLKADLAQG
jgi:transposase